VQRGATLTPHAAARLGRVEDLRRMLERDPQAVRQRGGDGQLPLHFAATPELAELLLAHGAEIDALDVDHASTAAEWRASERPQVAAYLVERGARSDPVMAVLTGDGVRLTRLLEGERAGANLRVTRERFPAAPPAAGHIYLYTVGEGCTLMHAAAIANRPEMVRALAAAGAKIDARGGYDDGTPLHVAAWRNNAAAAEALLDAGADINAISGPQHRNEPIGWAIVSGAAAVVRVLLARGAPVRDVHRADAADGVGGRFRCFNRQRPLEAWREVAAMLRA
jgi:ankyrin repeat protein